MIKKQGKRKWKKLSTLPAALLPGRILTQLADFTASMVNTYSIETTVAEKLDAILSLMEFSRYMNTKKMKSML